MIFINCFYQYIQGFPKKDKYTLGEKLEKTILEIFELIALANTVNQIEKVKILEKVSAKLDLLKIFIRLSCELHILDQKKYILLQEKIQEIGRMLGGWLKKNREITKL